MINENSAHNKVAIKNKMSGRYCSGNLTAIEIKMRGSRIPYDQSLRLKKKFCESALPTGKVSS